MGTISQTKLVGIAAFATSAPAAAGIDAVVVACAQRALVGVAAVAPSAVPSTPATDAVVKACARRVFVGVAAFRTKS